MELVDSAKEVIAQLSRRDQIRINNIMRRLRIGLDGPDEIRIERSVSRGKRRLFVEELYESGFTIDTIMAVCDVSRPTVHTDLEWAAEERRRKVDQHWVVRKFITAFHNLERHGKWAENRAEDAVTDESAALFRAMAITADKTKAELLLKVAQQETIKRLLVAGSGSGEPTTIEDVFAKLGRERQAESERARLEAAEIVVQDVES